MDHYDIQDAIKKIWDYFYNSPARLGNDEVEFEKARKEVINLHNAQIECIKSITFERFAQGVNKMKGKTLSKTSNSCRDNTGIPIGSGLLNSRLVIGEDK